MKTVSLDAVGTELRAMASRLVEQSLQAELQAIVPVVQAGFEENFAAAVDSTGESWPPRKDDAPHALLNETGALLAAVTGGGAGNVTDVGDRAMALGVDKGVELGGIPGAGVHNFGFGRVPQREYLYASGRTLDRAVEVFADGALKAIFEF